MNSSAVYSLTVDIVSRPVEEWPSIVSRTVEIAEMRPLMELAPLRDYGALKSEWQALEAHADCTFFNSWAWMGTWIGLMPKGVWPQVCRVYSGRRLIGLAVLGRRKRWRCGIPFRQIIFNASGREEYDSICIEMNQFLAAREDELAAVDALFRALVKPRASLRCEEILLPGMRRGDDFLRLARNQGYSTLVHENPAPFVDLDQIRASGKTYVEFLGKKVRYAIRKARLDYGNALGEPQITRARTREEAGHFLTDLARLHQLRWAHKGKNGAFSSPTFLAFHRQLLAEHFDEGHLDLFKIQCAATVIGFIYAFRYRDIAWFYQCGFDYDALPRSNQPGYLALPLVISYYLSSGAKTFEFLHGDDPYKRRLSTSQRTILWIEIQSAGIRSTLLRLYRSLRHA
jgi:CelD/BcsL family acetyltransferase involved in cellulose biosynthesis